MKVGYGDCLAPLEFENRPAPLCALNVALAWLTRVYSHTPSHRLIRAVTTRFHVTNFLRGSFLYVDLQQQNLPVFI